MQQLELKHIAPYLPYDLKFEYSVHGVKKISEILNLSPFGALFDNDIWRGFEAFKPILKPISEFDPRTIQTSEGAKDFIGRGWCDAYDDFLDICSNDMANIEIRVLQAPQPIFNYILSEHYDVFGLIDKGLAISANDIK